MHIHYSVNVIYNNLLMITASYYKYYKLISMTALNSNICKSTFCRKSSFYSNETTYTDIYGNNAFNNFSLRFK